MKPAIPGDSSQLQFREDLTPAARTRGMLDRPVPPPLRPESNMAPRPARVRPWLFKGSAGGEAILCSGCPSCFNQDTPRNYDLRSNPVESA